MVTILPIDVDQDLVREGLALASAARLRPVLRELEEQVSEMETNGVVARVGWEAAFAALARWHDVLGPVLEYARAFQDQWPAEPEGDGDDHAGGDGDAE